MCIRDRMDMTDKIKETEVLRKHIIGENGISYTLGEDGLYYPLSLIHI